MLSYREYVSQEIDSSGIRTYTTEVNGAVSQRLRPLGHGTLSYNLYKHI